MASGTDLRTFAGHDSGVWSVAFSPRGTQLASASHDQTVKLWDVDTGALLATLYLTGAGEWVVTTRQGRIDGSPGRAGGESLVFWRIGDVQLPGFVGWQRYHAPELLGEIMKRDAAR